MRGSNTLILLAIVLIVILGVLTIYSCTSQKDGVQWKLIYQRQILWAVLGLLLFFTMANVNYRRIWDLNPIFYGCTIFLLVLVFALGITRLGAQRWLKLGWFNLQPSEVAKLTVVIFLARYFSKRPSGDFLFSVRKLGVYNGFIRPFIFVAIPMGLIVEQPDLGSGLLLFFTFLIMVYAAGVKARYLMTVFAGMLVSFPVFWAYLRDYQKQRLLVFINPNIDPLGAGYTIIQSKIAIGSGGLFGKGWFSGTQSQLRFLPESHTDFIFASFAEEWGFLGCCVLLLLYAFLIRKGVQIALRTHDYFGRLLAFGISFMFGVQVFVNIAMNMGFAPVVGVPLPLMSYGGSSMFVTCVALGILANINKSRSVF